MFFSNFQIQISNLAYRQAGFQINSNDKNPKILNSNLYFVPTKLGQNFLINKDIVKRIIQSANLTCNDLVLEIGPGKGILTEELAKYAGKVVAVEIDKNLVSRLDSRFRENDKVEITEGDILKLNTTDLISNFPHPDSEVESTLSRRERGLEEEEKIFQNTKYKIITNLPYYITSPVIRKFLEAEFPPSEMILMVQKEVAERITAIPGKMSILAVSVQYYARPEILFYVEKGNFDPVPEVDSAVIRITPHPAFGHPLPKGEGDTNKDFFRILRAGFCAKRKTLANNLSNSFHLDKKVVEEKLKKAGISPTARAQELSIEEWKKLAETFTEK